MTCIPIRPFLFITSGPRRFVVTGEPSFGTVIIERSSSSFNNYDNMPEETRKAFITMPNGEIWFNSNDLGYMNEKGFIFITGRTNRIVIKNDFKISLDDIELKINKLPFIKDCATIISSSGGSMEEIGIDQRNCRRSLERLLISAVFLIYLRKGL